MSEALFAKDRLDVWPNLKGLPDHLWELDKDGNYNALSVGFELSCVAVPFERIIEVLDKLPRASFIRIYFEFLFLTGCRPSEAERFLEDGDDSFIRGNYAFWRVGKNQNGQWRKEYLPDFFLAELEEYKRNRKLYKGKLFPAKAKTLTRYFNKFIRHTLSQDWQVRCATTRRAGKIHEFVFQIKGIRKSFAMCAFWQYWSKYGDANTAVDMTVKRLRHSSRGMTVSHYLDDSERLNRSKWQGMTPSDIIRLSTQTKIENYNLDLKNIRLENEQKRLLEYQ